MRLTLALPADRVLVAEVDPGHEAAGEMLLARLAAPASGLSAGESATVDVDWAPLRLRADERLVVAEEPEYGREGAPFHPSLTVTSALWAAEQRLIAELDLTPEPVTAMQFVHVSDEALRAGSVVGHRRERASGPFTGWEIVSPTDELEAASFGYYTVRELAARRPAWLAALSLPRGWSFRFVAETLVDCVSPAGETHAVGLSIPL